MRLLYLVPKREWDTKMSRVRFHQIAAIEHEMEVHVSGPGWRDWDLSLSNAANASSIEVSKWRPDLVLTYLVDGLGDCPWPKATQYNEAFDVEKVQRFVYANGIQLVIFHHENDMGRYPHWTSLGITRVHLHHCASTDVFKDYGEPKTIDILVAGNLNDYYYPFRRRLAGIAKQYFAKRGYRVVVLPHPGYALPPREGTVVGEAFARMLNRSRMVFTCSMRYNYALAKYSEIALCRALPVGDIPGERKEFFKNALLDVEPWMTDAEIIHIIETTLDTEGAVERLTADAYDANRRECTMAQYAERFKVAATGFLEGRL